MFAVVHRAGGVVLLAHPGRAHGPDDVRRWVEEGLDGVEVHHPANPPAVRGVMAALVSEMSLLRSGGSDWHGPETHRGEPGTEPVPARWLDEIVARCERRGEDREGPRAADEGPTRPEDNDNGIPGS